MKKIEDSYGLKSIMKDGERYFRFKNKAKLNENTHMELRLCVLMQGHTNLYKFIYGHTGNQTGNENVSLEIADELIDVLKKYDKLRK